MSLIAPNFCLQVKHLELSLSGWEEKTVTRYENTFEGVTLFIIFEKQKHKK
jgi:hypothetical protein